jgi:hypothetical protein
MHCHELRRGRLWILKAIGAGLAVGLTHQFLRMTAASTRDCQAINNSEIHCMDAWCVS